MARKSGVFIANGSQLVEGLNPNKLNTLYVWGTFGGGNITMDCSPDGLEFFDIKDDEGNEIAITAKTVLAFKVKTKGLRITLAGAAAPNLNWAVL